MRELHVVALSEDGQSVLLATSADAQRGGFRLALDDRLAAALRGDLARPGESRPRDSALTPKEIQTRLRAGESAEQIAQSAGVALARVERFSGPVLSERARVIDDLRAAYLVRGRRGPSAVPLGEAVDEQLAGAARPDSITWGARRQEDGLWFIAVTWVARGRTRHGRWFWDPAHRGIRAVDPASAALGHLDMAPTSPAKRPPLVVSEIAPAPVGSKRPAKRSASKRVGSKQAGSKQAGSKQAGSKTAGSKRPAAKTPARRSPATTIPKAVKAGAPTKASRPTKASKATKATKASKATKAAKATRADKATKATKTSKTSKTSTATGAPHTVQGTRGQPARTTRGSQAAGSKETVPTTGTASHLRVVPQPDRRAATTSRAGGRASVPAWSEVLLGTSQGRRTDGQQTPESASGVTPMPELPGGGPD